MAESTQSFAGNLGGGLVSQALGGLLNQGFDAWSMARQWKYQQKQMQKQQEYALEQMQKQFEYEKMKFDYTNAYNDPVAVMQRYAAAGINPSAVLGSSGASMQATMDSSGGSSTPGVPSGGSLGGRGAGVGSFGNLTPADIALKESETNRNNALADESRVNSDLLVQQRLNAENTYDLISEQVDRAHWEAVQAEAEAAITNIRRARTGEQVQLELNKLQAEYDKFISETHLNDEQAKLVKNMAATEIAKATMLGSQGKMYRNLGAYYSILTEDLQKEINSLMQTTGEIPVLELDKSGQYVIKKENGKAVTRKVSGYDIRSVRMSMELMNTVFSVMQESVAADWANPNQWNNTIQRYLESGGKAISSVVDALKLVFFPEMHAAEAAAKMEASPRVVGETTDMYNSRGELVGTKKRSLTYDRFSSD